MSDHAQRSLVWAITQSLSELRLAAKEMATEGSREALLRILEEADCVSSGIASLVRNTDLEALRPKPIAVELTRGRGEQLLHISERFLEAVQHGICRHCGGINHRGNDTPNKEQEDENESPEQN